MIPLNFKQNFAASYPLHNQIICTVITAFISAYNLSYYFFLLSLHHTYLLRLCCGKWALGLSSNLHYFRHHITMMKGLSINPKGLPLHQVIHLQLLLPLCNVRTSVSLRLSNRYNVPSPDFANPKWH